jgi:hypothetical protein
MKIKYSKERKRGRFYFRGRWGWVNVIAEKGEIASSLRFSQ